MLLWPYANAHHQTQPPFTFCFSILEKQEEALGLKALAQKEPQIWITK